MTMMHKLEDYEILAMVEDWDLNKVSQFEKVQEVKKLLRHVWAQASTDALRGEREYLVSMYVAQENPYSE